MKRIIFAIILMLLAHLGISAENSIYTDKVCAKAGDTVTLSIKMDNDVANRYCGFQFDVSLPDNMHFVTEDGFYNASLSTARTTARKTNYFDCAMQANGALRVLCNTSANDTESGHLYCFAGTSGEVCTIDVKIDDNAEYGEYAVQLSNVMVTDYNAKSYSVADFTSKVEVSTPSTEIISMNMGNIKTRAGETFTMSVQMNNSITDRYCGFQFDVKLPDGLSFVKDGDFYDASISEERTTAKRTNYFDCALQGDGSLRILCNTTAKNKATGQLYCFTGISGEVCTIRLKANDNATVGEHNVLLGNIMVTDYNLVAHYVDDYSAVVEVEYIPVSSVSINKPTLSLVEKRYETLTATVNPGNATDKTLTWKSSNNRVATVDVDGKVTAVSAGTATITATSTNGKTAKCQVTVTKGQDTIKGDANGDGSITMADANAVVNYFLATDKSTVNINVDAADVNSDGEITMADANQIVNMFLFNDVNSSSSMLLADKIAKDPALTLFSQALKATGLADSLVKYIDETYSCGDDSVHTGYMVRCTSGSAKYTRSFWVGKRYFKYTAFVEPDSIYRLHGINNLEELTQYAKKIYDQTYPDDAGLYDDNPRDRRNPLNRFVSYHLLNRVGQYNTWVCSGETRSACWLTSVTDPEEFYESMCPGTMMRFAGPAAGLFINRKGVGDNYTVRGVKVLSPSESGNTDQNALNGVYHYLDDILAYTPEVRDVVLNCRIRMDATVLSPDFINCNGKGRYGEDILTGFKNGYITDWKVSDETYVGVHSDVNYWNSYCANAVCISGIFDVSFKLPPVPSGTYEIRLGYTCGKERGVVQVYLNNELCGAPVDLRVYGPDPSIGWVEDTDDEEENMANDKAMHNRGYMKAMDSYRSGGAYNPLRANNWNLRRILTTQYLDENKTYHLRFRQLLDDSYWAFDYIELCPESVYGSPEGEDRH